MAALGHSSYGENRRLHEIVPPDMLKFERKCFPDMETAFSNPLKNEPPTIQNWIAIENLYHDNIIHLPRGPLGRYVSRRTLCERGLVLMVTYSDLFQFVIMLCAVITLVIHFTRKK